MNRAISANSIHGHLLLALRAGRMTSESIYERFPTFSGYLLRIKATGHITIADGYYTITAAGLRACPSRRDAPREPLHQSPSSKSRKHGWSSTRQGTAA